MDNPAVLADVQARFPREFTAVESRLAATLLDDAWEDLVSRPLAVESRLEDGSLRPALVVRVIASMVVRVLLNPEGLRQTTRAVDDYSQTDLRDSALSTGMLAPTPDELLLLGLPVNNSAAFRIDLL